MRLQRFGTKKRPFYRLVAAHSTDRRDGRFIEMLGTYNPVAHDAPVTINQERVKYWLSTGAQPSETVTSLLKKNGIEVAASRKKA